MPIHAHALAHIKTHALAHTLTPKADSSNTLKLKFGKSLGPIKSKKMEVGNLATSLS